MQDETGFQLTDALICAEEERDGEREQALQRLLGHLTPRYRYVIDMHFGLAREGPQSLKKIGDTFGLSRERIRQIRERALEKLRDSAQFLALETADQDKIDALVQTVGDDRYYNFPDIPFFWFRLTVMYNPDVVASWQFPGTSGSKTSHWNLIKAAQ